MHHVSPRVPEIAHVGQPFHTDVDRTHTTLRACAARLPRQDTATDEEHKEALLEASREWLQASRDALLKVGLATGKVSERMISSRVRGSGEYRRVAQVAGVACTLRWALLVLWCCVQFLSQYP